jgi:metal-sulfur cluster biosynthetic enzyme
MFNEEVIREALRACYATPPDHTQPVNIVDLGMVEAIAIAVDGDAPGAGIPGVPQKHRIAVTLLAVAPEEAQAILSMQIANCLAGLQEVSRTNVQYTDVPAWTPDRISPAGRQLLGLDFPILNNRVR